MDRKDRTYDLGLYEKAMPSHLSWDERFKLLKETGFDFIEISIDETDERIARLDDLGQQLEIFEASRKYCVPIRSICLSAHRRFPLGSHDVSVREKSFDIFSKAVDMAVFLGVRTIQLAGYDVFYEIGDETTRANFMYGIKRCIDYASQKSVVCGFETMETDFMNTVTKIMKTVTEIDSPYCQVYPDLGNLTNASLVEGDLYDDLEKGKGHLVAAHLKETIPNHFREIDFGSGHVEFHKGITKLFDLGVRTFVCECWYMDGQDYQSVLNFNNNFLREYLDKLGES